MDIGRPYSRLLSRLERVSPFTDADRQRVAGLPFNLVNCPAYKEVVACGDSPSRCVLVLDGFLYGYKIVAGSRRQIISFFIPGDVADLSTLYCPRIDYGVAALGSPVLAFVPHSALREVVHQSPNVAQAFWLETLMQSAISREWVASLGRRDAVARTAHIICELAVRLQANGLARDLCFRMPWTQIDLADACGISNVHANRVVKELRQLGLVKWEPKRITIKDWHALVRVAEFDADYLRYRGPGSQSSRSRIRHDGSTKHGQPVFHPFVSGGDEVSLNGPGQQTSRP